MQPFEVLVLIREFGVEVARRLVARLQDVRWKLRNWVRPPPTGATLTD